MQYVYGIFCNFEKIHLSEWFDKMESETTFTLAITQNLSWLVTYKSDCDQFSRK